MALNKDLFNTNDTSNFNLLTSTLNLLTDLVYIMKVQENKFIYKFANTSAKSILKCGNEIIGQTFHDIFPQERANYLNGLYTNVAQTKKEMTFEEEIKIDNKHYHYESILTPIINGEEMFIITVVRDITKQSQSKKSIEQLAAVIESNEVCIFTLDIDGFFLYTNSFSENIIGYRPLELVGTSFAQFLPKRELYKVKEIFQQVVNGETVQYETAAIHKNGKEVQLEIKNIPLIINGKLSGVYGIAREITKENESINKLKKGMYRIDSAYEVNFDFHSVTKPNQFELKKELLDHFNLVEENITAEQNDHYYNWNKEESNRIFEQVRNELDRLDLEQNKEGMFDFIEMKETSTSDEAFLRTLDYRAYFTKLQNRSNFNL